MDFYLVGLAANCKRETKLQAFIGLPGSYNCSRLEFVRASISAGAEKGNRASGKVMQLYYEYTFWSAGRSRSEVDAA